MRIFKHIEIFLDSTYSTDEKKNFIFSSRCVCNFIERSLVKYEFQSQFSRLNIHCTRDVSSVGVRPLKFEPYLEVFLHVNLNSNDSRSSNVYKKNLGQIILSALELAKTVAPMPLVECSNILKDFEDNGYRNQWVYLDKSWKKWNCRCVLSAEVTTEFFNLFQEIYRNNDSIARLQIAQTKPREPLFYGYFGDLTLGPNGIIVYKNKKTTISEFDLNTGLFALPTSGLT